jgi:putative membrane-bound dehydrogenase-like protein
MNAIDLPRQPLTTVLFRVLSRVSRAILVLAMAWCQFAVAADPPPKSLDPRIKIELFAEHPQIVTPTGLDVDHRGRVFAIENNTHFPPEGYKGHPTDRVLVMSDSDGDGKADKIVVFTDGLKFSMSVVVRPIWFPVSGKALTAGDSKKPAGDSAKPPAASAVPLTSVYIATRREIFLFHDDDGDDKADRKESIVHLDTKGDYPHNGLAGFAIDALGWMYFGFGENLGADYKIIGSDGTTLSGGGEGGNIYRCRLDGSKLSQIATGFWNPHASCFDAFGRLFTVDNDADSRPPCRLLHVIPGGDYGYRFRNGRKGLHPFTAWNGEIPGTLPMVAGTGEAPSGILAYESDGFLFAAEGADRSSRTSKENSSGSSGKPPPAAEEYLGNLLVTSWGDHRIDRFRLQPKGTSFTSLAEPLITGGENFRPVGLATAPDGSLFCTDWVLRDYKLHGHGRIWRIAPKEPRKSEVISLPSLVSRSEDERKKLLQSTKRREVRRVIARTLTGTHELLAEMQKLLTRPEMPPRAALEVTWAFQTLPPPNVIQLREDSDDASEGWEVSTPILWRNTKLKGGEPGLQLKTNYYRDGAQKLLTEMLANKEPSVVDRQSLLPLLRHWALTLDDNLISLAMSVDDPFVFSVVVANLADRFKQDDFAKYLITDATPAVKASAPKVRQAMLLAARKQAPREDRLLRVALSDHDPDVRRLAVQWVAEEKLTDLKPRVAAMFDSQGMTTELFLATIAALEMLDGKKPEDFDKTPAEQYVVPLLKDEKRSPAVRAQALRLVSPTDKSLDAPLFASLLKSDHEPLRLETVRTLQGAKPEVAASMLREIAADQSRDVALRAEAIVGLAAIAKSEPVGGPTRKLLRMFLNNSSHLPLRLEALRAARPLIAEDAELRDGVLEIANSLILLADGRVANDLSDQVSLAFAEAKLDLPKSVMLMTTPKPKDRQEWMAQLNRGRDADPAAGRRIFFHPNGPGCFKCHIVDGRGGRVGPDLSRAVGTMNRVQLIQSILEPSREIAPQFTTWTMETTDGKVLSGMLVHENEGKTILGDAEGKLTELKTIDIVTRTPQRTSVMPDKLADRLTVQEFRDVLAFLESLK